MDGAVSVVLVGPPTSRIAAVLTGGGMTVLARTADPARAAQLVTPGRAQVAVVALDADGAGLAAIGAIAAAAPDTSVLAVSAGADHTDVLAAVRAGAAGCVADSAGAAELVDAVRRTAGGEAVFSPGLAEVVLEAHGRVGDPGPGDAARLTDREADVLRLVVEGLTGRQIATRLVLSPRTVENHVQHVLRKLALPNRAALVRYAIENGLV